MACTAEPRAPEDAAAAPVLPGADVVLVTVSALRADAFEAGDAPLFERLAAAGRVFTSARTASVASFPAHATLLTGRWPHQHGVRDERGFDLPPETPALPVWLAGAGYATAAFVSGEPLAGGRGLEHGFGVYDDRFTSPASELFAAERGARETVAAALEWWQSRAGARRFLWLHLFEPHFPYRPPQPYEASHPGDPYLGEVAAAADALESFLESFLEGREPAALVVLTADHGEARGERGERGHGLFAYEPTLRVPLVVWYPGVRPGRDDRAAGHVDLVPTLAAALELDGVPGDLPGRPLFGPPPAAPRPFYFEALTPHFERGWAPLRGVLYGGRKLIDLPRPELYDLAADPGERQNLLDAGPVPAELRALLPYRAPDPEPTATWTAPPKHDYDAADDPKELVELDRLLRRALELAAAGRLAAAEELAREARRARPQMAAAHVQLAALLREQDRREEALEVLEEAYALGALSGDLRRRLGRAFLEAGRSAEAAEVLEPWVETGSAGARARGAGPAFTKERSASSRGAS